MDFNDQSQNLYCDPNAYVQNCPIYCNHPPKKVVFSEPYSVMPNFYINNNFKKGNCACLPKPKPKPKLPQHCPPFGNFNLGGLGEMFSKLMAGGGLNNLLSNMGGGGIGSIIAALSGMNNADSKDEKTTTQNSILSNLLSNGGLNNLFNIFKPSTTTPAPKNTPNSIKDYVIVEE